MRKSKRLMAFNETKRTVTARNYYEDGTIIKWRTLPFSKEEWAGIKDWSDDDWNKWVCEENNFYIVG